MSKFLANENVPTEAVELARQNGLDMAWIMELAKGADDDAVRALSVAEGRVLVTFDKAFGEMAFRQGKQATCGVLLMRPRPRNPDYLAQFMITVLSQQVTWEGNFAVAREAQLRVVPLPEQRTGLTSTADRGDVTRGKRRGNGDIHFLSG